jgi:hypothetical protein
MSTHKTMLLIGGSRGGETVEVDQLASSIRVPLLRPRASWVLKDEPIEMATYELEIYTRERLRSPRGEIEVFVKQGIDPIEELLAGYHPSVSRVQS